MEWEFNCPPGMWGGRGCGTGRRQLPVRSRYGFMAFRVILSIGLNFFPYERVKLYFTANKFVVLITMKIISLKQFSR